MAPPYISEDVRAAVDLVPPQEELQLAVVASDEAIQAISDRDDIAVERVLPSGVLIVTVPSALFDALTSIGGVRSISLRDRMEIME